MTDKILGQYLKELRRANGFSQEFVASHLNIVRQTYSHYETGRLIPPVDSLYRLASLYGVSVEKLLDLIVISNGDQNAPLALQTVRPHDIDDTDQYLDYIKDPANSQKIKYLDRQERMLLFYYSHLDARDQKDILTFMQIKKENRENQ